MVNAKSSKIVGKTKNMNGFTNMKFRMPERDHVKENGEDNIKNVEAW